jgi:ABC-2 type transport system permease protein
MNPAFIVWRTKALITTNYVRNWRRESKLKIIVIAVFATGLWVTMGVGAYLGLAYIESFGSIGAMVLAQIFALMAFASFFMLAFSNLVIGFATLYTSDEATFLLTMPMRSSDLFAARFAECVVFSSWAVMFLGAPFLLSYGLVAKAPWQFYGMAALFAVPFILIPALAGCVAAVLLARLFPRLKLRLIVVLAGVAVAALLVYLRRHFDIGRLTDQELISTLDAVTSTQSPLLPSYWVAHGMLAAVNGAWQESVYWLALLVSNLLMLWIATLKLVDLFYFRGYSLLKSKAHSGGARSVDILGRIDPLVAWMSPRFRALVLKDIRLFWRDATQWSQFALFFGLMALYIANIRSTSSFIDMPNWRNAVSWLNFGAAALILATLTTRFVFPLISLEGRRFWIVGLAPVTVRFIIWQKFAMSCATSMIFTLAVIVMSNVKLDVSPLVMTLSCGTMVIMNFALNGLAVGLGATYPNFREDNPGRIVSGLGGTLTFVLSSGYLILTVLPQALIVMLHDAGLIGSSVRYRCLLGGAIAFTIALSAAATFVPMHIGRKSLESMEF